ncbi:hypothetical protein AT270_24305 [Bacillus cereus]|nr:hypothetical protein AT270_24305 [Bacillus cereus]
MSGKNRVLEHAIQIFEKSFRLAKKLKEEYLWIVVENGTNLPLYSSDSPLILRIFDENGKVAQAIHEIPYEIDEYAFPLTSNLLLIIVKAEEAILDIPNHRKTKLINDNKIILSYNEAQLHSSYRQLFCLSDTFEMINGLNTLLPDRTSTKVII